MMDLTAKSASRKVDVAQKCIIAVAFARVLQVIKPILQFCTQEKSQIVFGNRILLIVVCEIVRVGHENPTTKLF